MTAACFCKQRINTERIAVVHKTDQRRLQALQAQWRVHPRLKVLDRFNLSVNSGYSSATIRATFGVGQLFFAGGDNRRQAFLPRSKYLIWLVESA
jgi:hypothetical protein